MSYFFFFQAEDGIRDIGVTGVQTCALPISAFRKHVLHPMKIESGADGQAKVWGWERDVCLNAIGYGQTDFSQPVQVADNDYLSVEQQVLTYCYYFMRWNYSSSRSVYGD